MPAAEQFTEPITVHGEGPVWSGGLHLVDMLAGDVVSVAADGTEIGRRHVGEVAAALRPRVGGGFVYAVERGFALDDGPGTPLQRLPEVWADTSIRMNEGGCDPLGRFYCGSMAYAQTPGAAALYRLDPDGAVHQVLTGVTVSNGVEFSPDGSLMYYDDTPTGEVAVFDHDPGAEDPTRALTNRRRLARVEGGGPDGLTVDAEGGVWVALFGGAAVHRYAADGSLDEVVEVDAHQVTACTFGGPELDELFITTSREGLDDGVQPLAGAVFRYRPGVKGRPVKPFAG